MQFTNLNVPPTTGFVLKYKRLKLKIVADSGDELSNDCQQSRVLADMCVLHFIHIRILFYTSTFPYDGVPVVVHVPHFDKP
jgi:hypothetical protein